MPAKIDNNANRFMLKRLVGVDIVGRKPSFGKGIVSLISTDSPGIIVIRDKRVGEHTHEPRAQLRSLPLLFEYGFDRVLHTGVWDNDFRPIDYERLDPNEVSVDEIEFPLVHVVSQEGLLNALIGDGDIAKRGEQHLMRDILRTREEGETYVIVSDTDAPKTPDYAERPITDDFSPVTTIDYKRRIDRVVQTSLDSAIPLSKTRNYWYHQISDHHRKRGAPGDSLPVLFDYDQAPPNSPAWWPLYYFVEYDLDQILEKYTERIRESLRSWTERGDVQKIANNMDSMLVRCNFRVEDLDEQRARNAEQYDIDTDDIQDYDNVRT